MLTIHDLKQTSDERKKANHDTCRQMLALCHHDIKTCNNAGKTWLMFTIPHSLPGRPTMPSGQVAAYLIDRLLKGGIHARTVTSGIILVDWSQMPANPPRANPRKSEDKKSSAIDADETQQLRRNLLNFRRRVQGWTIK